MSPKKRHPKDDEDFPTTGHEWDGIREYDKPMPRWWVITFYISIVWAIGYMILYPAWPLINGATPGLLGYSSRGEVAADIAEVNAGNAAINARLVATPLVDIAKDVELNTYAFNGGQAVFRNSCSQCHGAGANGVSEGSGYPSLLDDDWLWGGKIGDIYQTITVGIRAETNDDTRLSEMPKFGEFLEKDEIANLVQHVLNISGQTNDAAMATLGAVSFEENCAACHGDNGLGDREVGAPNLTDAIWLYGGDTATLTETITNARYGIMPTWAGRLTESQIRQVTSYVHQLGGGENE